MPTPNPLRLACFERDPLDRCHGRGDDDRRVCLGADVAAARDRTPDHGSAAGPADDAADESLEHKQITDLAQQIADERGQLPVPTAAQMSAPVATCMRNTSATCTQTCQLTDSICSNADKICEIAKKLHGDDWADKKCTENRTTCTTATTQCCECTP